jgi:hypothetical protein
MTNNNTTLLSKAMQENALFSATAGIVLIAGAPWLDTWLGVNGWLLVAAGVALIVFAADLVWWSRSARLLNSGGRMAVISDIAWVVGAASLIAFTAVLTRQGEIALALVSTVVAGFAAAQWIGLKRLNRIEA